MKKYKVGLHYSENGHIEIEAETKEHAEAKVIKMLEENGTVGMEIDMVGREYLVTDVEEKDKQ